MPVLTPSPALARWGVSLMFFTNGVILAGLLPRYPEIKSAYALSGTQFGFLVVSMSLGAICAATAGAPLIRRFGARTVNGVGSVVLALVLALSVHSPVPLLFGVALFLAGTTDAIVDSAQNVQGVVVEQWRGRSIINSFHAIWSLGAATGGVFGTWCAAQHVALTTQMAVSSALAAVIAIAAAVFAATPDDVRTTTDDDSHTPDANGDAERPLAGTDPWRLLVPLVVLAICGALMEEVANSWSALFMARETDAPRELAGLGFTAMLASQCLGRFVGDPMTDRWGREAVARLGGLLAATGMTIALVSTAWVPTLLGFGLMGFGSATLIPAAFAAAGRIPGLAHGSGITILSWLLRLGFLVTSPVIGVISDAAGLRAALVVPLVAALIAAALSHRLARRAATE